MDDVDALAASFRSPDLVTIALEDGGDFKVPKALLCLASDYFTKALESDFIEGQTQTLGLPACDTPTFKLFLFFLCHGELPSLDRPTADLAVVEVRERSLAALWIFGDMIALKKIQNAVYHGLEELIAQNAPFASTVLTVFAGTPDGSRLRDYFARKVMYAWYKDLYSKEQRAELGSIAGLLEAFAFVAKNAVQEIASEYALGDSGSSPYVETGDLERYYNV